MSNLISQIIERKNESSIKLYVITRLLRESWTIETLSWSDCFRFLLSKVFIIMFAFYFAICIVIYFYKLKSFVSLYVNIYWNIIIIIVSNLLFYIYIIIYYILLSFICFIILKTYLSRYIVNHKSYHHKSNHTLYFKKIHRWKKIWFNKNLYVDQYIIQCIICVICIT